MWTFQPSPKISPTSSRVLTPEQTEARVRPLLHLVPVTRLSDLTPLATVEVPVFNAVTPLARDLTTHMGKGPDKVSARVSAMMEAIERVSAETPADGNARRGTFAGLRDDAPPVPADPGLFDLPEDSRWAPDREFTWIEGFDLVRREAILLPADLVLSPPSEGVLRDVDTNGLASGNTLLEAVVHGLGEVIERDALSQLDFAGRFADGDAPKPPSAPIDLDTVPPRAVELIDKLRANDLDIEVHDITGDVGVATFRTIVADYRYPGERGLGTMFFGGCGTAPNAELALVRSITEAAQSHLGYIQGARDAFNTRGAGNPSRAGGGMPASWLQPVAEVPFARTPTFESDDLHEDLGHLLQRLVARGFDSVQVFDLRRPDLGVPVVRVRVPGLSSFCVNRRRVGWRCLRYLL